MRCHTAPKLLLVVLVMFAHGAGCGLTSGCSLLSEAFPEIVMECFKWVDLLDSIKYLVGCSKF